MQAQADGAVVTTQGAAAAPWHALPGGSVCWAAGWLESLARTRPKPWLLRRPHRATGASATFL